MKPITEYYSRPDCVYSWCKPCQIENAVSNKRKRRARRQQWLLPDRIDCGGHHQSRVTIPGQAARHEQFGHTFDDGRQAVAHDLDSLVMNPSQGYAAGEQ